MKAIVMQDYGPVKQLKVQELPKPNPGKGEVLIRVHSTAVNDYDWAMIRGKPYLYRLFFGLLRPKYQIPGMELSGTVESCGPETNKFKPGDKVFGDTSDYGFGTFAEFVNINEKALFKKPSGLSFEQAAATPHACMLAIQGLRGIAKIRTGQSVLVNGAGGGVGAFALGFAKAHTCHCTGVDAQEKIQHMKDAGFDEVVNYQATDFTRTGKLYDIILDTKTNRPPWRFLRALAPGGVYCTVGGSLPWLLLILLSGFLLKVFSGKSLKILALKPNQGIEEVFAMLNTGQLSCPVDGPYPLSEAPQAIQRFGDAHHLGKVILST